jgi:spermidine synthase
MEYVEVARAVSARGELVLRARYDTDPESPVALELRANGIFVMDTCETSSEKALATAALDRVEHPRHVVVGGLGLGFTMHEVLADPRVEKLAVVEIEDTLVQWMRDGTVPHGPAYLADQRVSVITADIRDAIAEATPSSYDLVLLDIDNGPGCLVHDGNQAVYQDEFLSRTQGALRPGGALVIWSADAAPALQAGMERVFGNVTPIPYDVTLQNRAEQYWLYLSRRPASAAAGDEPGRAATE